MKIKVITGPSDANLIADIYRSDMGKFGTTHTEKDIEKIYISAQKGLEEIGKSRIGFLLFERKRVVGTIQLMFKRSDNDILLANGVTVAHIHHLRVAYDLHGKGLGRLLMETTENWAWEHGFRRVTLGVDSWNTKALGFYYHLNYKLLKEVEGKNPGDKIIYLYKNL